MLSSLTTKAGGVIVTVVSLACTVLADKRKDLKMEELIDKKVNEKVNEVLANYVKNH